MSSEGRLPKASLRGKRNSSGKAGNGRRRERARNLFCQREDIEFRKKNHAIKKNGKKNGKN